MKIQLNNMKNAYRKVESDHSMLGCKKNPLNLTINIELSMNKSFVDYIM